MSNEFCGESEELFTFVNRGSKLILTAPHAVKTFLNREGIKSADAFTGPLTEYLGEECEVSTIVRTKFIDREILIDEFVEMANLREHFFLDLHGMVNHDDFDLAVGTGLLEADAYKKALDVINELSDKYQLRLVLNHPKYSGISGMKAFTTRLQMLTGKPQVLQLEWGRDFRDFYPSPELVLEKTLPFMKELISTLEKELR